MERDSLNVAGLENLLKSEGGAGKQKTTLQFSRPYTKPRIVEIQLTIGGNSNLWYVKGNYSNHKTKLISNVNRCGLKISYTYISHLLFIYF